MKYDLTIFGGGTAGTAAAYIAAKKGLKTLLVEKTDVLGGAITQGLVIPCMKLDTQNINTEFYNDLILYAKKYNAQHTYIDGNSGWFNPELLKIVLDDMLSVSECDVLFSSEAKDISFRDNFAIELEHKLLSIHIESNYIVDATAEGKIFKILNCNFQKKSKKRQTPTLRFIVSGIETKKFSDWLTQLCPDRNVTTKEESAEGIYLSTAVTSNASFNAPLGAVFDRAIAAGDLKMEDRAYFQVFSVANMPGSLAFNCPRIFPDGDTDNPFIYSKCLKEGRSAIFRLYNFCKKYFPGFENAFISRISDTLGIRESNRIKGVYTLTKDDVINGGTFENTAFASDYPIDIHGEKDDKDCLQFIMQTYHVPVECLISSKYDNLYAAGRIISAEFEAQAAVRTQLNCFSMGEAVAKHIYAKIRN